MIRPAKTADIAAICAIYSEIFAQERAGENYTTLR